MALGLFLGIDSALLHILLFRYLDSKKKKYLLVTILLSAISCLSGKSGIVLCGVSFLSVALVHIIVWTNNAKDWSQRFSVLSRLLLIFGIIFLILIAMTIYNATLANGTYKNDVLDAYISNLYGAKRFSVMPFFSIPIMHFIYTVSFLYFLLFRKQKKQDALFATTLITALLYIIVIGIGYINVWAADNIVQTGEYMTGFERFMLPITSFLYAFILYSVGMRLVLNKK